MRHYIRITLFIIFIVIVSVITLLLATLLIPKTPKSDRAWLIEQSVAATTKFDGEKAHITNIRNFSWRTPDDFDVEYYDKTFDLSKLKRAYFVYTPFSNLKPLAHTFMTFEFEGPEFLSVSVEIRKEGNETYGWVNGLLKQYELFYVIADERDSIGYRVFAYDDPLYIYPIKTTPERARSVLVEALMRANKLEKDPEFYHTFFNNCTTNLVRHVNSVVPGRIPWLRLGVILPGYADALAYRLGLIDTELTFEEAQKRFYINDRAKQYADEQDFSTKIRNAL